MRSAAACWPPPPPPDSRTSLPPTPSPPTPNRSRQRLPVEPSLTAAVAPLPPARRTRPAADDRVRFLCAARYRAPPLVWLSPPHLFKVAAAAAAQMIILLSSCVCVYDVLLRCLASRVFEELAAAADVDARHSLNPERHGSA